MPLSNISSVLAETTSGKNTRRLQAQDEGHGGAAESASDTGSVHTHTQPYSPALLSTIPSDSVVCASRHGAMTCKHTSTRVFVFYNSSIRNHLKIHTDSKMVSHVIHA